MPLVDLGNGVLYEATTAGSGTGNYDSFLRLAANGTEEGYNTDFSQQLDNKDGIWTHDLLISNLAVITVNDVTYYEIRLDLNEIQSGTNPNISLNELQIYYGAPAGEDADFSALTNVFDLSGSLALVDTNHGSGTDDYRFLIPTSLFPAGAQYLTLYADFSGSDDGFEEFRVKSNEFTPLPDIGVLKVTNGVDDECRTVLAGEDVTWTYTVENNGNIALSNVTVRDDAGTPDVETDDFFADYVSGDTNSNGFLDVDETWTFSASGIATDGEYANVATVSGDWAFGGQTGSVSAIEEDCYEGVTPEIDIVKLTNGLGTCPTILIGENVTWTYTVTNPGDIALSDISVVDDNGTVDTSDDFTATAVLANGYNVGDSNLNGLLDGVEEWQFTYSGIAIGTAYVNVATASGTATDGFQNSTTVTDTGESCYDGADPSIDIVKMTNGTDDLCPVLTEGTVVTWTYVVTNTGNIALSDIVVRDDNGTAEDTDDIIATLVSGDLDNDSMLDIDEIWTFSANGIVQEGHYENVATVSGTATDDVDNTATVTASEDDCYVGVTGPGVRTPGFWSNWTDFWDGDLSVPTQASQDCFADYDLLRIDSNGDGTIDGNDSGWSMHNGQLGLLIGDYDRNGIADPDEDVIFISLTDALNLINANNKQMSDGVVKIGRDVVASWLNYLAGNPIGTVDATDGDYSPREAIDDAIDYLQIFGDKNNSGSTGNLSNPLEIFDCYSAGHTAVRTSGAFWTSDFPGGSTSGATIHDSLDEYNNFGTVDGVGYAHDCDQQQFLTAMSAFSVNGDLLVC
jgi:hypothetical protein